MLHLRKRTIGWGFVLIASNTTAFTNNYASTANFAARTIFLAHEQLPDRAPQQISIRCNHCGIRTKNSSSSLKGWFDNLFPAPIDDATNESSVRSQQFPEQYPATYELNPAKYPGDTGDAALARPLLKNTQLESRPLKVVYNANNLGGWNTGSFHKAVDGKGAAIVLCKARGAWFGGYNPKGWSSTGGARPSVAAFLFYQNPSGTFQKLRKVGGGGLACAKDDPNTGIWLGADGLIIPFNEGKARTATSKLGTYFERGPDQLSSLFPSGSVELSELKVLVGVYAKGEEIPYSGAVLDFTSG